MTNTPPALPAFPTVIDTQGGRVVDGIDYGFEFDAAAIAILSARADAWEARARLAVEELQRISHEGHDESRLYRVRGLIGPLPPLPPTAPNEQGTGA
jgi:hypothetical protein